MPNLMLDRQGQQAKLNNRELQLDHLEFDVLWILSSFTGRPLSLRMLIHRLDELEQEADECRLTAALSRLECVLGDTRLRRLENGHVTLI